MPLTPGRLLLLTACGALFADEPNTPKAKPAEPAAQPRMMSLRDWYVACGVISLGVSC